LAPYKLPKYLPVRIFSLEYIRKMINFDDIHFVSLKKKQQLIIKGKIGSFICNNRGAREEADMLLKEMKFFMSFPWHNDPCGIISEMRVKNKNIPYVHESRPEVEKFANQMVWEPNTLVEPEQQDPLATVSQTTTPQVLKEKRPSQDLSPSITEVSPEEFQLYTKRSKTISAPDPTGEKEVSSTTVTKVDRPPLSASLQHITTSALPKKSTNSLSTTQLGKVGPKLSIFEKYELIKKRN
jgi:hypothetical protein